MTEAQMLIVLAAAVAIALFFSIRHILIEVRRYEEAVLTAMPEHGNWITGKTVVDYVRIRMRHADPWKVYAALNRLERKGILEANPYETGTDKVLDADAYGRWRTVMPTLLLHDVAVD